MSTHQWQGVAWGSESVTKGLTHLNIFLFGDKISTFFLLLLFMEELRGLYPRRETQESLFRFTWGIIIENTGGSGNAGEKRTRWGKPESPWGIGTWPCLLFPDTVACKIQVPPPQKVITFYLPKLIAYILSAPLPQCWCHCPTEDWALYEHSGQWLFPASDPGHGRKKRLRRRQSPALLHKHMLTHSNF